MRSISNRNADLASVIKAGVEAGTKSLRCACPAIVQSWNPQTQTVTAQLAIKEILKNNGAETETEIPLLVDVPIITPRAGGYSLLLVPKKGDECLVVFADMCIDSWWQSGGVQSQAERRRHDLSDGFAILGVWSQPNKVSDYPEEGISFRNDEGTVGITIDSEGCHFTGVSVGVEHIYTNKGGVGIGMQPTGTSSSPSFDVSSDFKTAFNGGFASTGENTINGSLTVTGKLAGKLADANGSYVGNTYSSTASVQVGQWIDGRAIYRKVYENVPLTTNTNKFALDITVDVPIRLWGMANNGSAWHPINSYYSGTYHAYARLTSASEVTLHSGSNMTGFLIIEYVPATE